MQINSQSANSLGHLLLLLGVVLLGIPLQLV